ncbi:MAG: ABC transporter ATP-binding protein [Bacteroidetes bacterium]|nr:ABC transporter ATP-binding protein [Bacteroidota bacterium]
MKLFFRVLSFSKPFSSFIPLYLVLTLLAVVFGVLNFGILIPLLDNLFNPKNEIKAVTVFPDIGFSKDALKQLLDYVVYKFGGQDKHKALLTLCVVIGISVLLSNVFRYFSQFILTNVRTKLVYRLKKATYEKMTQLDVSFFTNARKGNLLTVMSSDVHEIENSIVGSIQIIFREPFIIISYFVLLFTISVPLTLFSIVYFPCVGLLIALLTRSLRKKAGELMSLQGDLLSLVEESISSIRIIKAFNNFRFFANKFDKENEKYRRLSKSIINKRELASPVSEVLGVLAVIGLIIYGGSLVLSDSGELSGAQFLTYLIVFSMILNPAKNITVAVSNIQKALASCERIFDILDTPINITNPNKPVPFEKFSQAIEYKNLSFAYHKGDNGYVLKNINLKIAKGKTIALVGQSGSGKTTLADMLPRFYDCDKGELLIDGINIKDIALENLRHNIGIVTQESVLFNDTVQNNIVFGLPNVSQEQITEAAKIANAHEFITQLPQGYNTTIGDRGGKLSGGQRQRLSIARAVLKNPDILILDEATSALDTESEKLVQEALSNLMRNRTSIVIAHRLSTIANADEIIVMHKGEIIERGNHAELLAQNGTYKKLCDMQSFK